MQHTQYQKPRLINHGKITIKINNMNNLKITLAELLDTDNMTIYRNAMSILKEMKKQTSTCQNCNAQANSYDIEYLGDGQYHCNVCKK